jgi:hypothetical protein
MSIVAGFVLSSFFFNLYSASVICIISLRDPPIKTMDQLINSGAQLTVDVDARNSYRFLSVSIYLLICFLDNILVN